MDRLERFYNLYLLCQASPGLEGAVTKKTLDELRALARKYRLQCIRRCLAYIRDHVDHEEDIPKLQQQIQVWIKEFDIQPHEVNLRGRRRRLFKPYKVDSTSATDNVASA